jgi:crossover junction endodeoxyribonuclease RuvC
VVDEVEGDLALMECGALTFPTVMPMEERLRCLYQGLVEIMARYGPDEVAIEEPFVARNVHSALAVGRVQAIAMLVAANQGIPVYRYTPAQVKQQVTSYGASDKGQVQEMVRIQLGLGQTPQPEDAADALAVAICHIGQRHLASLAAEDRE